MSDIELINNGLAVDPFGADMFDDDMLPPEQERTLIPRMYVAQGLSDAVATGAVQVGNFYVQEGDKVTDLGKEIQVAYIAGGYFPNRTMWAFDKNGKKDQSQKKPVCGSGDGVTARKQFLPEGRDGQTLTFTDWRDGATVNILPNNCENCPLGGKTWKKVRNPDGTPVLNEYGKSYNAGPPCRSTPNFLFYVKQFEGLVFFQGGNMTLLSCLEGRSKKHSFGASPSVSSFYKHVRGVNGEIKEYAPAFDQGVGWCWLTFSKKNFSSKSGNSWGFMPTVGELIEEPYLSAWVGATQELAEKRAIIEEQMNMANDQRDEYGDSTEAAPEEIHPF